MTRAERCRIGLGACFFFLLGVVTAGAQDSSPNAHLLTKENVVDASKPNAAWSPAIVGQELAERDLVRTGELSKASLRLTNLAVVAINELTTLEILPPEQLANKPGLDIHQGDVYFFSREKPQDMRIETPTATGALRGTEFHCHVGANGRTSLTVLDGKVELSNAFGHVLVNSGEQGNVEPGQAPTKTAVIDATNIIQWCLYYPGIVDAAKLDLPASTKGALAPSLEAYNSGDLLQALKLYPPGRVPSSDAEKLYRAALILSVGQVDKAQAELRSLKTKGQTLSLNELIAAVKYQAYKRIAPPHSAEDWMAESYYQQANSHLDLALNAAKAATAQGPDFGFAWTRLAELEFSFGRTHQALAALNTALRLSPRNAEAIALRGFLLSAQNKIKPAAADFDRAIAIDGALGNAWLGRGLCEIRQGHAVPGRNDLQTAAALEPNRSILRSYLGKAFSNAGNEGKSRLELGRAEELDPNDPTPWLYSAIENRMDNRLNQAVRDLETSQSLNNNRRVFRSQFLLDQDQAVRSANLAAIYQDDGMVDVSVREAVNAVNLDYSNPSAHLFLANSYDALRDPHRIVLRYETPWFNELLLSNLLAPVGGGPLSQFVSQEEYSKLFEANRIGLNTNTQYTGDGELVETASQYGIFGNFSYSLDTQDDFAPGIRPNNNISRSENYAEMKFQLTPDDTLFLQTKFQDTRNGDVLDHYYDTQLVPGADTYLPDFHFSEMQTPGLALVGFHHEWYPGVNTLLLLGRLADHLAENQTRNQLVLDTDDYGNVTGLNSIDMNLEYQSDFITYSAELQQIFQTEWNTLILGARFQTGSFTTRDLLAGVPDDVESFFENPPAAADVTTHLRRSTAYIYDILQPLHWLSLTGGFGYDQLQYPTNFRDSPVGSGETPLFLDSPKLGLLAQPLPGMTIRGAYTRSLGGASFDESVLLEPTQVAGFTQVYRTLIPENVVGEIAGPRYENEGISLQQKFGTGTYIGVDLTKNREEVQEQAGLFLNSNLAPLITPGSTPEHLAYTEKNFVGTVNQLLGDDWSIGAREQLTYSKLHTLFNDIPVAVDPNVNNVEQGQLNQLLLFLLYSHPSGFFCRFEALWDKQINKGYAIMQPGVDIPNEPGDDFWQLNAYAGYRFRRNMGEITLGLLDINGANYHLNPLNVYNSLPRSRTVAVTVRFTF